MSQPQLDKSSASVRAMFNEIAPTYDLLNGLLSANQDSLWRYRSIRRLGVRKNERVLDLCCGTGDVTRELARQAPQSHIIGADFSPAMLAVARNKDPKHEYLEADALALPFEDGEFDVITIAFGVRNFEDTARGVREMARVLKPGGRLLVLEFMRPARPLVVRFFGMFNALFSPLGRLVSRHSTAYNYLPQSVEGFCSRQEFTRLLREEGFTNIRQFEHTLGIASSFLARKVN